MKTFSEAERERQTEAERIMSDRLAEDRKWLKSVEQMDIKSVCTESPFHASARDHLRYIVYSFGSYRLGIACDNCGVELINPDPTLVLACCPPKIRVGCIGCGWSGYLTK